MKHFAHLTALLLFGLALLTFTSPAQAVAPRFGGRGIGGGFNRGFAPGFRTGFAGGFNRGFNTAFNRGLNGNFRGIGANYRGYYGGYGGNFRNNLYYGSGYGYGAGYLPGYSYGASYYPGYTYPSYYPPSYSYPSYYPGYSYAAPSYSYEQPAYALYLQTVAYQPSITTLLTPPAQPAYDPGYAQPGYTAPAAPQYMPGAADPGAVGGASYGAALPVLAPLTITYLQGLSVADRLAYLTHVYGRGAGIRVFNHHFGPAGISRPGTLPAPGVPGTRPGTPGNTVRVPDRTLDRALGRGVTPIAPVAPINPARSATQRAINNAAHNGRR